MMIASQSRRLVLSLPRLRSNNVTQLKRTYASTTTNKKPQIVDLSRELYHRCLNHPFHVPFIQTAWDTHQPKQAGDTILRSYSYALTMSDHAGTHVDAFKHFGPGGKPINEMPLEMFYTSGFALDLSYVELGHAISVAEMEDALSKSGERIQEGDTVLIDMAYNKRVDCDDPRWQHVFPGLAPESVHWLADKGCKMFGVEAISPSPEGEMNFKAHNICGERGITHMEGLNNIDQVVGKGRCRFIGFPLKLRGGSGSPIRAVAVFE